MYRQLAIEKCEENKPKSYFQIWKDWWNSRGQRLPNERRNFKFLFEQKNGRAILSNLTKETNVIIVDDFNRKIVLDLTDNYRFPYGDYSTLLEISLNEFSRKYKSNDKIILSFPDITITCPIWRIVSVRSWFFGPPINTILRCKYNYAVLR